MRAARWFVGLAALASALAAQAVTFTPCGATGAQGPDQAMCDTAYGSGVVSVSGGIQSWTVPTSGTYSITATGAQGAAATSGTFVGGRGARVSGTFDLTAGQVLQLVVGQAGSGAGTNLNGGGGGGSFVVSSTNSPLLIAGGGGGTREAENQNGCDASVTEFAITGSGSSSTSPCTVKTTERGLGGVLTSSDGYGSAGAGFNGDGASDTCGAQTLGGGLDWAHGMLGGAAEPSSAYKGGFGGGADGTGCEGGGGGGGYSGGDGGFIAGGGGSFNSGTARSATVGAGTGDGSIAIVFAGAAVVPVPALSTWGLGVLGSLLALTTFIAARRGRRLTGR